MAFDFLLLEHRPIILSVGAETGTAFPMTARLDEELGQLEIPLLLDRQR